MMQTFHARLIPTRLCEMEEVNKQPMDELFWTILDIHNTEHHLLFPCQSPKFPPHYGKIGAYPGGEGRRKRKIKRKREINMRNRVHSSTIRGAILLQGAKINDSLGPRCATSWIRPWKRSTSMPRAIMHNITNGVC